VFDTEFGDLPLLSSSTSLNVTISEFRAGNSVSMSLGGICGICSDDCCLLIFQTNFECGGPTMGFCERITGTFIQHTVT